MKNFQTKSKHEGFEPNLSGAVSAKAMGFDPMSIDYIKLAHEDGLGTGIIEEIEIVGENISKIIFQFSVGNNMAEKIGHAFLFGPLKKMQWLFFHTPIVYLFVFGSYLYHDFIWWPFVGKRILDVIQANTEFGMYFANYPSTE